MARAQLEIPDSLLDKAAKSRISKLERENKNLAGRLATAEKRLREVNYNVQRARRTQEALRAFVDVLKEEWDLQEDNWR